MKQMREEIRKHFHGCLVPQVSLEEWSKTYNITSGTVKCPCCDKELNPETPFAMKGYRGIIYETCDCEEYPKDQAPFKYVSSNPKVRQATKDFVDSFKD